MESASPSCSTRPMTGCGARSTPFLFLQLSRNGNLQGSGMSHSMTASPKQSFRAPWSVGNAAVSSGNAGWTTCQNCSCRRLKENLCRIILHDLPVGKGTEVNCSDSTSSLLCSSAFTCEPDMVAILPVFSVEYTFILFLCLFLFLQPFQLYFIP